jgi:hypothetical protein
MRVIEEKKPSFTAKDGLGIEVFYRYEPLGFTEVVVVKTINCYYHKSSEGS